MSTLDKFTAKLNELVADWVKAGSAVQEKTEARIALEEQLEAAEKAESEALKAEENAFYKVADFRADLLDGGVAVPEPAVVDQSGEGSADLAAQPAPVDQPAAEAVADVAVPDAPAAPITDLVGNVLTPEEAAAAQASAEVNPVVEEPAVLPVQEEIMADAPAPTPDLPVEEDQPKDLIDFNEDEDFPDFMKPKEDEPKQVEELDPVEAAIQKID